MANVREPVVAGQFYPADPQTLKKQIESFINPALARKGGVDNCLACLIPHAGYIYSGRVAVETISQVKVKDKIILLGPNHTGNGAAFSIMTQGIWKTPLGLINVDSALAKEILEGSKYLEEDSLAHAYEHSLEVELPILQYFKPDFEIVPIAFLTENAKALKEVGKEIGAILNKPEIKDKILIVASSDMTHYEAQADAEKKDKQAIEAILELNSEKLTERIKRFNISMCGWAPAVVMIEAAKSLGAKNAKLISYLTSGDITGDRDSVVGYAGITLY